MRTDLPKVNDGDKCPHCKIGLIEFVNGYEPYNVDHLMCSKCDSTYVLDDTEQKIKTNEN